MHWMWGGRISSQHPGNMGGKQLPHTLAARPIVGYRTWLISGDPAFRSIHIDYLWQVENTAECRAAYAKPHSESAPAPGCSCGFYVQLPSHPLEEWDKITRGRIRGSGTVALSGRVIRCEFGYKAQYAELQSPIIVEADCRQSSYQHPCPEPVGFVKPADLVNKYPFAWCEIHQPQDMAGVVEASPWITRLCADLEARYPGVEVLSELAEW